MKYKNTREYTAKQLEELFSSVRWESAKFPERLARAMKGFAYVRSAWDGDRLVGLIAAMDDGEMTAYIHYLLVSPEYQGQGIGKKLLAAALEHYSSYERVVLHAEGKASTFYLANGFCELDAVSMGFFPASKQEVRS